MKPSLRRQLNAALAEAASLRARILKMRRGLLELVKDDVEPPKSRRKTCPARSHTAGKCARPYGHESMHANAKGNAFGAVVT